MEIKIGNISVCTKTNNIITANFDLIKVEKKTIGLLLYLDEYIETEVSRESILRNVWGEDRNDYWTGRSMDVYVSKLRKILKHNSNLSIKNRRGFGFTLLINK